MLHWLVAPNDLTLEPFGNRLASITDWGYMRGNNVMPNEKYNVRTFYLKTGREFSHCLIYRSVTQITYMSKMSLPPEQVGELLYNNAFHSTLHLRSQHTNRIPAYSTDLCLLLANSQTPSENGPK